MSQVCECTVFCVVDDHLIWVESELFPLFSKVAQSTETIIKLILNQCMDGTWHRFNSQPFHQNSLYCCV